jgi:hypothetical protein
VSRAIIFAGYSLADLDIARILIAESSALRAKTVFFIAPHSDEIEVASLDPYGVIVSEGIEKLFDIMKAEEKTYVKPTISEIFYSISDFGRVVNGTTSKSAAVKVHEQLVYGTVLLPELMSAEKVFGEVPFNIPRDEVQYLINRIIRGDVRDSAIIGGLASGKTFAALQVAQALLSAGYRVYWVLDGRKLRSDLDRLVRITEKACLIVDGYSSYLDEVRDYVRQRPTSHILVATERSATHELLWTQLRSHLLAADVPEIVLDDLSDRELAGFEELVNFAGLWGEELAGRSRQQRLDYATNTLGRSLYKLLLEIIKSKKVQQEIQSLLEPLRADTDVRDFFTTAFIVSILRYNFWINDWQAFYKLRNAREVLRKHATHIAHFVLVDVASIRPRSGVMSLFMVHNYIDDETIVECLSDIYEVATTNCSDNEFERAHYDLIKYDVVEPIFSPKNKLAMLIKYYEEIRRVANTRNNPDYWLQMGIACTIYGHHDTAERAFGNAYSREKAKARPNLIKIDNYFARFQIERAAVTDEPKEAFNLFKSGISLLLKQIFRDENRHYPFKPELNSHRS